MGGQGLKLGTVPYLNAKPLTIALEERADVDLRSEPPSKLAKMLAVGELDAALVSAFALFHSPGSRYVPGVGIATEDGQDYCYVDMEPEYNLNFNVLGYFDVSGLIPVGG